MSRKTSRAALHKGIALMLKFDVRSLKYSSNQKIRVSLNDALTADSYSETHVITWLRTVRVFFLVHYLDMFDSLLH